MDDEETDMTEVEEESWGDRLLSPDRPLTARHKKLAELAASGMKQGEMAKALGYSSSRISILLSNSRIRDEIEIARDRIFEETVGARLRKLGKPALDEIEKCLTDKSGRYKEELKQGTARWVVEKIDGKAAQKIDIGENMLGILMDRLDSIKQATQLDQEIIEVTPLAALPEPPQDESPSLTAPKTEEDLLDAWVKDFSTSHKR